MIVSLASSSVQSFGQETPASTCRMGGVMIQNRNNRIISLIGVLAFSLLMTPPTRAQVVGARLSGTVTDNSGAVIPNVQVLIKNVGTGETRSVTTDAAGFYSAPNLLVGGYEVSLTAPGFKTVVRSGITLTVGGEQVLDIILQVGEVSEKVEVTTEAPSVQLASSSMGTTVLSNTVVELPLNGRDWAQLTSLEPGVSTVRTQFPVGATSVVANRGFGPQMTIAGTRPQMNNYRLDGISVVDYSGGSPSSVLAQTLGVDAIAEFSVVTSNHSAEYGRTSGGVINAITRSGTNSFHGNAYWFLRDEGWDARSATDPGVGNLPPFHRNQFGGTMGGPILHNKTFFFVNYEGFRQTRTTTVVDLVPSTNARNGILAAGGSPVSSCPAGTTLIVPGQSNVCVSSAVIPFLAFWPTPSATQLVGTGDTGKVPVGVNAQGVENFWTNRIDHRLSEKDSISGSWYRDTATFASPDALGAVLNASASGRTMITAEETHTFSPSLLNAFRIGYSRVNIAQNKPVSAINPLAGETTGPLSGIAGRGAPAVTVTGLQPFLGGLGEASLNNQRWNSYQLYDDAFLTKGAHSLKFGFTAENMRHAPENIAYRNGGWYFAGLGQFLTNAPYLLHEAGATYGIVSIRQTLLGGYVQDDWRFRSNLTLNLGIRYEASTVISEASNQIENLRNLTDTKLTLGAPLYNNPTLRDFEPRIGFAWDPFRTGKTSVRGAFGVFDVQPQISEVFGSMSSPYPFYPPAASLGVSSLPQGIFPIAPIVTGTTTSTYMTEFNPKRNYVMVWNLSAQRQLSADTSVTVGYVANRGIHMFERTGSMNMEVPQTIAAGGLPLFPTPLGTGPMFNSTFGQIGGGFWDGDSFYRALEVQVRKRYAHGFQLEVSYTSGKNDDTGSSSTVSDTYINSISTRVWFCKVCRLGPADFNQAQKIVGNFIWDLPTPKTMGAFASHVLGGWEVGGIITAESGTPFTPFLAGDPQKTNSTDSPFDVPNRLPGCSAVNPGNIAHYINLSCFTLPMATPAIAAQCVPFTAATVTGTCANLQGNAGRNSLTGPGLFDADFSLIKNTRFARISENFNAQFRVEMFNVFNHPSWQAPLDTNQLFSSSGAPTNGAGSLTAVTVPGREIQFGLKLIF